MPETPPELEIDWLKTLAGALAAVTTAVLLSTLGAVGTLIGAALGSIAATVGSAFYAQGLARSRYGMRKAQETARMRLSGDIRREDRPTWAQRLGELPWRRVGLATAGTFAAAMVAVTGFEAVSGHSVSSYTGGSASGEGSTIGGVTGNSGHTGGTPGKPHHTPSTFETPSGDPSVEPSGTPTPSPTDVPTPTPTPAPATPTDPPTQTDTPTDTPSPTTTP